MTRRHCVNPEPIDHHMGGGHLCTGPCGAPHLHGRRWVWWQCPICKEINDA